MLNFNWTNVKSALVSGVLMALLVVIGKIVESGDIFSTDWNYLLNAGIIAFLTSLTSLVKSLLTTDNGNFVGAVRVRD